MYSVADSPAKSQLLQASDPLASTTAVDEFFARAEADEALGSAPPATADSTGPGRSAPVTIQEIQDHVWMYSHEVHPDDEPRMIPKPLTGGFASDGAQMMMEVANKGGRRKMARIIHECSAVQQESDELRRKIARRSVGDKGHEERAKKLERSYSAMRYRKFLDKRGVKAPDFIDHCDFKQLRSERKAEKEKMRSLGWSGVMLQASEKHK
jgi:hypothetical protein